MASPSVTPYVEVKLTNNSGYSDIYVFVQSQTQIYKIDTTNQNLASPVISPTNGNAPSVKLSSLKNGTFRLNANDNLTSGRVYFSDKENAVQIVNGTIAGPAPDADFIFDFVELTIYTDKTTGKQRINLDTSQIDQFGIPINVQVVPNDTNYPDGTGIVKSYSDGTVATRTSVIDNFTSLTKKSGFKAYADCVKSTRLLGPQHAIGEKLPQYQYWITDLSPKKGDSKSATAKIRGNWKDKEPTHPPIPGNLKVGMRVSGQGIPKGTTISAITPSSSDTSPYTVSLTSPSDFLKIWKGAYVSFFPKVTGGLHNAFDEAIYNLFNTYTNGKELYLCGNGTVSGIEIFKGTVVTDYKLPKGMTDMNGSTKTRYTVFKFTGTHKKYNSNDNTLVPSTDTGDYVIFYPFFSTNCESSPNNNALNPHGIPAPPQWFTPNFYPAKGDMNFISPASLMVFACGGVFADSVYQNKAFADAKLPLTDDTILGNIENQLVTMLNRGISLPDNFVPRIGYVNLGDIAPVDTSNPTPGTKTYPGANDPFGATTNYHLDKDDPEGNFVIKDSVSGTVTLCDGSTQTFQYANKKFTVSAKPSGTTCKYVTNVVYVIRENKPPKLQIQWSAPPSDNISVVFKFKYGKKLSKKYATLNLISPYINVGGEPFYKAGDFGPTSNFVSGIKKGMKMTTIAQFSTPMEVYSVPDSGDKLIIKSSVELQPFNTGILFFADFYPLKSTNEPDGVWNGYSYYFHQGDLGKNIPTVDGRGYAFPFDDNGGFSSDLSIGLNVEESTAATVEIELMAKK